MVVLKAGSNRMGCFEWHSLPSASRQPPPTPVGDWFWNHGDAPEDTWLSLPGTSVGTRTSPVGHNHLL
jgi:hypothetical protein